MAKQKIYAPFMAREFKFNDGGTVLKLSGKSEKLIDFVQRNTNAKGYCNLIVSRRREVGQYGDTHTVYLDTWEPKPKDEQPKPEQPRSDDLPF